MCRSIKTLRRAETAATTGELEAAARQFVRKISGYRTPSTRNADAFEAAIAEIAASSEHLLEALGVAVEEGPDRWVARGARTATRSPRRLTRHRGRTRPRGGFARDSISRRAAFGSPGATPRHSRASTARRSSSTTAPASPRTPGGCRRRCAGAGLPFRLRFALKANPLPEVLEVLRGLGAPGTPDSVGIDACSPGEVRTRHRLRLATRRDQLHRHQRLRARPRRAPRTRRPRQPRRDQPDRALRPAGARDARSACGSIPASGAGYNDHLALRRRPPDQVRDRPGSTRRGGRRGPPPRPDDRHGSFPRRLGLAG